MWTNYSAGENGDTHHEDKEWRFHSIDVSEHLYRGGVQIKYEIQTDGGLEMGGWTIDDFVLLPLLSRKLVEEGGTGDSSDTVGDGELSGEDKGGCSSINGNANLWFLLLLVGAMAFRKRSLRLN